jgi:hypothetical protein
MMPTTIKTQQNNDAGQRNIYTRKASFSVGAPGAPATLDEEKRSVGVVLATENPVSDYDWIYGRTNTILLMSGVVLPPDGQTPLLDSHNSFSVSGQFGSIRNFTISGSELHAEAFFSATADQAFTMVREGHLRDVSVSYKTHKYTYIPQKASQVIEGRNFTGPVKVVTKWEVVEGSMTPIGADKKAKTRAASDSKTTEVIEMEDDGLQTGERAAENTNAPIMDKTQGNDNSAGIPAAPAPAPQAYRAAGDGQYNAGALHADMLAIGRTHDCVELAEAAIRSGVTLQQYQRQVLDHLAQASARSAPGFALHVQTGEEDRQKYRAAAADALCLRAGARFAPPKPALGASELRGYTLRELARDCLRREGLSVSGDMDMIARAFTTTSDFPAVLADAAHKAVLSGALEAAEVFDVFCGEVTAVDFRKHSGVALDAFSALDIVPESGEYTQGAISDRGIAYEVATYGKLFGISRQAIINDDVNAFTQIPAAMGRAAMRTAGNAVFKLLTSNPQMSDGSALFSAQHGNLAAAGAVINVASLGAAITAMGTQKGSQGEALNIAPAYLICAIARRAEALILLNSMMIGTQEAPNQVNPWKNVVQPVTDARLDFDGSGAWFLSAQKGWGINTAWLGGNKTPRVEQRQGWTVDGTEFKVSIDFGCYVQDWRALFKNPGA